MLQCVAVWCIVVLCALQYVALCVAVCCTVCCRLCKLREFCVSASWRRRLRLRCVAMYCIMVHHGALNCTVLHCALQIV